MLINLHYLALTATATCHDQNSGGEQAREEERSAGCEESILGAILVLLLQV